MNSYINLTLKERFGTVKNYCRQTCMSWDTHSENIFFDPRFKKHKIGNKWRFPAAYSKKFLLTWLDEQK